MKKLIQTSLITLALASGTTNASESPNINIAAQDTLSYACKVMLSHNSTMFCADEEMAKTYAKAAIADLAYVEKSSYACNTMMARGSEMFCQKGKAETFTQASN